MKTLLFFIGVAVGVNIFYFIVIMHPSKPVIQTETVIQTKYITQQEYIKVNQTKPVEMTVTAYTAGPESTGKRPGMKGYGITYKGTKAKIGVCAVDPDYIKLDTSLYVEGYGYCLAADIGGKVKGYHVDVFIPDLKEALIFGRETRKVWILNNFGEE
jgi:3D (Asp-Asp-Asp) domain-containing protein